MMSSFTRELCRSIPKSIECFGLRRFRFEMSTFTKAICRSIPRSIVSFGLRKKESTIPLDFDLAVKQHNKYVETLKNAGLQVKVLPSDENLPDCVFVEDVAVVIDKNVLITIPGAESRKKETIAVREVFEKETDMKIHDMRGPATLDGGDVLFTGREIFVGSSQRTNRQGIEMLRETFSKYPVHSINIDNTTLHLKSVMTLVGEDTIACAENEIGKDMMRKAQQASNFNYSVIYVPDVGAANCVLVNGNLICQSRERYGNSISKYDHLSVVLRPLELTEIEKVDGAFTCCSILY